MTTEDLTKSKTFKNAVLVIACGIILVLTFAAGVFVGLEKARFSDRWGENYYHNFVAPPPHMFLDRNYMNPHGSAGQIIKIEGTDIAIKSQEGMEKDIIASSLTTIKKGSQDIKLSDLKVNDSIVVIGSPNDQGQIEAKFIRVLTP